MKAFFTLVILWSVAAAQTTTVVPTAYTGTAGGVSFLGPLTNSARTYQLLINANQLTSLSGKQLRGFTFRLVPSASIAWPTADITFASYDVYLSESVAPAQRSLTFANNVVGAQRQVRSGSLTIPTGSFTTGSTPNVFGSVISFSSPYTYTGGNLLVEIRHTGFTGSGASADAIGTTASTGYGTNFSACWTGSYTGTAGVQGNFSVIQFTYDAPLPLVLSSFTAVRQAADVAVQWATASELNTKHFVVERSADGREFSPIATVQAAGQSASTKNYSCIDKNIVGTGANVVYYRLQMVDADGSQKTSPVAVVNLARKAAVVSLYPNPVKGNATLTIVNPQMETLQYYITTIDGKIVQAGRYVCAQGTNNFSVSTAQLSAGSYHLILKGMETQQTLSFIRQ